MIILHIEKVTSRINLEPTVYAPCFVVGTSFLKRGRKINFKINIGGKWGRPRAQIELRLIKSARLVWPPNMAKVDHGC